MLCALSLHGGTGSACPARLAGARNSPPAGAPCAPDDPGAAVSGQGTPTSAPAGTTPAPTAANAASLSLVREGDVARLAGDFTTAEARYRGALALGPNDAATLGLALCFSAWGRARDAARLLATVVHPSSSLSDAERDRASRALADAHRLLATVTIATPLAGTLIDVDGVAVGTTPLAEPLLLEPGVHALRASLYGHAPAVAHLRAEVGRAYIVELRPAASMLLVRGAIGGDEDAPQLHGQDLPTGGLGVFRVSTVFLSLTLTLGALSSLVVADLNGANLATHANLADAYGRSACAHMVSAAQRSCASVDRAIHARNVGIAVASALFGGAAVTAASAAISFLVVPPLHERSGGSSLRVLSSASPSGIGALLEASW